MSAEDDVTVFAGLSLGIDEVRSILPGQIRPPIRAGDLDAVCTGREVVVIDGDLGTGSGLTFREVGDALRRGVKLSGAASVGAWLASRFAPEGMRGSGWIFDAYRSGRISGTDEIAVLYDPCSLSTLTVPLVSLRHVLEDAAAKRVMAGRTLEPAMAAARGLSLADRDLATLANHLSAFVDPGWLARVLGRRLELRQDIKAADARSLIEDVRAARDRSRPDANTSSTPFRTATRVPRS